MSGEEKFGDMVDSMGEGITYLGHKSLNRATMNEQLTATLSDELINRDALEIKTPYVPGKIKSPDDNFYFDIVVNPDLECEAMVTPMYKLDVGSVDAITKLGDEGIVKLIPGRIGLIQFKSSEQFRSGIMAHEAVHCATAYMRIFEEECLKLDPEDCDDNEERLAWLIGWFTARITNYYYEFIAPTSEDGSVTEIDLNHLKIGDSITLASRVYEIRWVEKCYNNGTQVTGRCHPHERWIELGMDLPWDEIFHTFWYEIEHLINHLIGLHDGPEVNVNDEQLLEAKEHYQVQALKQVIGWQIGE